jgi:WD40 repeat protein
VTGSNVAAVASEAYLWSLPEGKRVRTIDFGQPSYWQVGPEELFAETLESGSAERPEGGVLRSWSLPDGEPVVLGRVDWENLGAQVSFFTPDGKGWIYAKGPSLYSRPLPAGAGPDHLFSQLGAELVDFWANSNWLAVEDKSGKFHVWSYPPEGPVGAKVISKPDTAPTGTLPDPSGRWLGGDANEDKQVRLWDLAGWKAVRPLSLRRSGTWYGAIGHFHPTGDWVVASTDNFERLTFWPLANTYASVVDGYGGIARPLAFSPDSKWLATSWSAGELRLWPLPGTDVTEARSLDLPEKFGAGVFGLSFDPEGRYVSLAGNRGRVWIVPLDGSPLRKLEGFSEDTLLYGAATSPSGRLVAAAFGYGRGEETLRVWNLETGEQRRFELPESQGAGTGYEQGITSLAFADETTLYTAGDGGLRRWNLETGSHEALVPAPSLVWGPLNGEKGIAITVESRSDQPSCRQAMAHDLTRGISRRLGDCGPWKQEALALDSSATVGAIGSLDGIVRVGRLTEGEPHLLIGHKGPVDYVAISPDLRWVASTGEDDTLRLWPMPDLSKPPLHTLPQDELLAKLRSLTNFRAVRDPSSATGWNVEVGPFPGWKAVPVW